MSDDTPARLAACVKALEDFFNSQSDALLAVAREPLLVAARDAGDREEEDRLLAVLEEVEALTPQVTEVFCGAMLAALNGPGVAPGEDVDSGGDDGLSLVDTAKVDDWLRLRGMLERQTEGARQLEVELWERLGALAQIEPHSDNSPVSLQCICVQFQAAMQGLGPSRDARAAIYDAFEATVVGNLNHLVARLHVLLEDVSKDPAPGSDSHGAPGDDVEPHAEPDQAANDARSITSPDSTADSTRVLGAMAGVVRRELDSPLDGLENLEERLLETIAPYRVGAVLDEWEQRTIGAVSRLVRQVVSDPDVDSGVQRRLSQLAPPLLMLALQDENYLESELLAARHDPVTGLLDRAAFRTRLEAAFKRDSGAAVCLLDVDNFGQVTRRLGYQVGGRLLRALADMLRKQAGRRSVVARLRGDEFAVILPTAKPGTGRRFADRYLSSLSGARFVFDGEKVELRASAGVVESDAALASPGALMRAADMARQAAKADGGSCVRVHESGGS